MTRVFLSIRMGISSSGHRHGRACPGHPRLAGSYRRKTWMPGPRPGMTEKQMGAPYSFGPLRRLYDLLRGVIEIVGGGHVEVGLREDVLALRHIGAFEPHHQRHPQAHLAHGVDHT